MGDAKYHCNRCVDTCSCGKKVVDCKPSHLGKITCCRFTTVDLPVCISDKARCGVDGKTYIKSPEFLWVKRQRILKKKNYRRTTKPIPLNMSISPSSSAINLFIKIMECAAHMRYCHEDFSSTVFQRLH